MPLPFEPSNFMWYWNRLGRRIVENYENSARDRARTGHCYNVTYDRIQVATQQVGDARPLPPVSQEDWAKVEHRMFYTIWGSHVDIGKEKWKEIPDVYRGRGAPAAMVGDGRGDGLMEADQIWAGLLEPGAVLQTWERFDDYIRVVNGDKSLHHGHSFILKEYVYEGKSIVGMKVIDNGWHGTRTVRRGSWGYWVATNVRCLSVGAMPRIPDPWWPKEPTESNEVAEPAY
ncbi:MAG: hypothetical protein V7604_4499 [Hyphomicrobiales bacterium]|jgi:hypothetical protein